MDKTALLNIETTHRYVLVIHGGGGAMSRERSTPELHAKYKAALSDTLRAGYSVLKAGGEAMDAAVAAVANMEDDPLFNSGKGAAFNVAGKNELEASIMLSCPPSTHPHIPTSRRGLGLTLLSRTRNPSKLARALYLDPTAVPHTMLSGSTAERIGEELGVEMVDESYFWTEKRWREHRTGAGLPEEPFPGHEQKNHEFQITLDHMPQGTVGAVALDIRGCIATVTSTGGKTNKLVGRIGDTSTMGSGFWAEEWQTEGLTMNGKDPKRAVGVSGTGDGDYLIRLATASTVGRRMKYLNESVTEAATNCVEELHREGGFGGVIAVDNHGNIALPLNCAGMYRGFIREDGVPKTAVFNDDELD